MPSEKYLQFAQEQINYILGAKGRSFLVGYGHNYPKRPYHAARYSVHFPIFDLI